MPGADINPVAFHTSESGLSYAGTHITIDIWGAVSLDDETVVDTALRTAAKECGATLLDLFLHRFRPQGLTAVAVLAESHISIHAWPEIGYAALDLFTCGDCDPYDAVPTIQAAFKPQQLQIVEQKRGLTYA